MAYPDCSIGRRTTRMNPRILRRRLAASGRPAPPGLCILHHCDEPRCDNLDHLFFGTHADNRADAKAKGRIRGTFSRGQEHRMAKLTEVDARAIREAYASGESQSSIGRRYGIHQSTVSNIVRGSRWSHLH